MTDLSNDRQLIFYHEEHAPCLQIRSRQLSPHTEHKLAQVFNGRVR